MVVDRKWIGHRLDPAVLPIERSRLQFFAKAIGGTDPVYTNIESARAAGYPDLPAPPTFLFAAELDSGTNDQLIRDLGFPLENLLHGEQGFIYHKPVCAGDTVTVESVITDVYDKKNGVLEFVVKKSRATNQCNELVAEFSTTLVCRH